MRCTDDSTLSAVGKWVKELEDQLNPDLKQIDNCCDNNHTILNTSKINAMLMTTWQKRKIKELSVYLKGEKVKHVENVNQNVCWEHHINKTNKTVNRLLSFLWSIKKHLPLATRNLHFNSDILPLLDYRTAILGASHNIQKQVLIHIRGARVILNIPHKRHLKKCSQSSNGWHSER